MNWFLPCLSGPFSLFMALHYQLPATAKGRALYYAKHLQKRPPVQLQERLLNLVDSDFLADYRGAKISLSLLCSFTLLFLLLTKGVLQSGSVPKPQHRHGSKVGSLEPQ